MKYSVRGPRIKLKIEALEKKSEGGIILADLYGKEKEDHEIGTVIELGNTAYKDLTDETPWCKVGDKVAFVRYAGKPYQEGTDLVRIIKDIDVIAVVDEDTK